MAHRHRGVAAIAVAALVTASCGSDTSRSTDPPVETEGTPATDPSATDPPATDPPATDPATDPSATDPPTTDPADPAADGILEVPGEFDTIQAAVDASSPGDLVLIAPGTYHEAVDVTTDEITIRGLDRDGVVLDGRLELDNGVRVLGATGVAVENLTATNYTNNGVFWVSSSGYRASYVTTYRTGDYGIYAFDSVKGQIEHSHTVGSRDAGIYIGQCYPCDAVVTDVVSSHNGLGYSGTNSGGNLLIVDSVWHDNRAGIVPNSGSYELCYPERETTVVGNLVYANNNPETAAIPDALLTQGSGIIVPGGVRNIVERNRVDDHDRVGIGLVPYLEETPNDDLPTPDEWDLSCDEQKQQPFEIPDGVILWQPSANVVRGNVITDTREVDLVIASVEVDLSTLGNCFSNNEYTTTAPLDLEALAPCDGVGSGGDWTAGDYQIIRWLAEVNELPGEVPWQEAPLPELGPHENMPDAATAPARPAIDVPFPVDLDAITVPELAAR